MEKKQTVIGVDPGKQGFITVMKSTGIKHYPMPKVGKELDLHELSELIIQISEECDINNTVVVIEDVHALPRSAAGATFTFGGVCYALRMGFIMCGLRIVLGNPSGGISGVRLMPGTSYAGTINTDLNLGRP